MTTTLISTRLSSVVSRAPVIERDDGAFVISAGMLADVFGLSVDEVRTSMREARITSSSEIGVGEDAGRWRLTFHYRDRACRFIVDGDGRVLSRATFSIRAGVASRKGCTSF
ncbi:DUF6522 family protein [Acuticoccus sediminis]|uniref:DUF6522 family protein n=1 Tax=Acuticoccus sediminis TaxID=2184697 RepID=UPI001CFF1D0F|nr:DUF6522 family protein [Acuticoccus sediminis]